MYLLSTQPLSFRQLDLNTIVTGTWRGAEQDVMGGAMMTSHGPEESIPISSLQGRVDGCQLVQQN